MTQRKCITHGITLTEEGTRRTFETPGGSIKGMPPCRILTITELPEKEGKIGDCNIKKVS